MKPTEDDLKDLFSKIKHSKEPFSININGCNYLYDPFFGKLFKLEKCYISNVIDLKEITKVIKESIENNCKTIE
jgi:hypothetical protein